MGARAVDAELRDRIAKLEQMVHNFQGDSNVPGIGSSVSSSSDQRAFEPPSADDAVLSDGSSPADQQPALASKYVASTFWSSLITEVQAIKEAFDEEGPEDELDALSLEPSPQGSSTDATAGGTMGYELILCPPGALYVMPGAMPEPDPTVAMELISLFFTYIEPMGKLFHVPTLQAFIYENQPYLGHESDARCNKLLRLSILFAGMTAITEEECVDKFNRPRDGMIQEYRTMVDIALYQADPLNSTDMATLQAFVLYVVSGLNAVRLYVFIFPLTQS